MVVDDHEVVRHGIRTILGMASGVTFAGEAADGEEALEEVESIRPDVVLMDIEMPKLNGVETLRRLMDMDLDLRVILLSTFARDEQIFDGLRAGARGYLMKDTRMDDLIKAIKIVHDGGSLLQPVIAERLIERIEKGSPSVLTERELEVLQWIGSGSSNSEIAKELFLTVRTVRFHVENIFQKLGVNSRTQAVRVAMEQSLIEH